MKKHQNSTSSAVSFFARCTVRSLFIVLGALLFVVTHHFYNAETVFKLLDFQITNNETPRVLPITNKEAHVNNEVTDNVQKKVKIEKQKVPAHGDALAGCDVFKGKWVYDNVSYPLYKDRDCKFMFGDLACESYGRKDLEYQHWRWQPHGCDLPRFDGNKLLERLRNKRLIFVGDSLNRNLWVSMMCMLDAYIPDAGSKQMRLLPPLYTFKAKEYNASFDFYWSPLLVESGSDNASNHQFKDIKVRIESIEKHAKEWNNADILVFNSYRWWRVPTVKVFRDATFEGPKQVYKVYEMLRGYKMALRTLTKWLESNINPTKTKLFFVSMAADHQNARDWGKPRGNCFKETKLITKEGYWGSGSDPKMMRIAEEAIDKLNRRGGVDMKILNITQLTEYRKDAHPVMFRKLWRPLSKEQLSDPLHYGDCTHWCLPGVPDVWNEILYAYIMHG